MLKPNTGGKLSCLRWGRDGVSFVFSESSDTADGRIYRFAWTDHQPAAPELLYKAVGKLVIHTWKP